MERRRAAVAVGWEGEPKQRRMMRQKQTKTMLKPAHTQVHYLGPRTPTCNSYRHRVPVAGAPFKIKFTGVRPRTPKLSYGRTAVPITTPLLTLALTSVSPRTHKSTN